MTPSVPPKSFDASACLGPAPLHACVVTATSSSVSPSTTSSSALAGKWIDKHVKADTAANVNRATLYAAYSNDMAKTQNPCTLALPAFQQALRVRLPCGV